MGPCSNGPGGPVLRARGARGASRAKSEASTVKDKAGRVGAPNLDVTNRSPGPLPESTFTPTPTPPRIVPPGKDRRFRVFRIDVPPSPAATETIAGAAFFRCPSNTRLFSNPFANSAASHRSRVTRGGAGDKSVPPALPHREWIEARDSSWEKPVKSSFFSPPRLR